MKPGLAVAAVGALALLASSALAQGHAGGHFVGGASGLGRPDAHGLQPRGFGGSHGMVHPSLRAGGDIGRLGAGDRSIWTHGRWRQTWHDGFFGWWWFVDGDWFLYPEPIYPYPTYVAPYDFDQPAPEPVHQVWYHCADPEGYYPYLKSCKGGWEEVPAMPPSDAASAPPGAPSPGP